MDDRTFGYVISSFGFKVETDVGIDGYIAVLASWDALLKFGRLV